jgi:peptide chain release factor 2
MSGEVAGIKVVFSH